VGSQNDGGYVLPHKAVNVATPEVLPIYEVANMIGRQFSIEPKFEIMNTPPANIIPDLGRLAARFDLSRFTRFEEGLHKTMDKDFASSIGSM
jgi:hypothetical protein